MVEVQDSWLRSESRWNDVGFKASSREEEGDKFEGQNYFLPRERVARVGCTPNGEDVDGYTF